MDPSSSGSFTSLLNSSTSSPAFQGPQIGNNQQFPNFPPPQFGHDFRPPPYGPIQQPHYPHQFNPFGVQLGFQQFGGTSSHHGTPYHEGFMQFQQGSFRAAMAGDPSSPVGSGGLFGGIGGSASRADESESPISIPQPSHGVPLFCGLLKTQDMKHSMPSTAEASSSDSCGRSLDPCTPADYGRPCRRGLIPRAPSPERRAAAYGSPAAAAVDAFPRASSPERRIAVDGTPMRRAFKPRVTVDGFPPSRH